MLALNRWGPSCWHFLHAVAHTAPLQPDAEQREELRHLLHLSCKHLPCPRCSKHCRAYLAEHMTDGRLSSREGIVSLLNDLHNDVNRRTGKRTFTLAQHREAMARRPVRRWDGDDFIRVACEAVLVLLLVASLRQKKYV